MRFCVNKKHRFNSYALRCYKSFKIYSYLGINLDNTLFTFSLYFISINLIFLDFAYSRFILSLIFKFFNAFFPPKNQSVRNAVFLDIQLKYKESHSLLKQNQMVIVIYIHNLQICIAEYILFRVYLKSAI